MLKTGGEPNYFDFQCLVYLPAFVCHPNFDRVVVLADLATDVDNEIVHIFEPHENFIGQRLAPVNADPSNFTNKTEG